MIEQAKKYAELSRCNKRKVGCVVVKDGEIISYGFNHGYYESCDCDPNEKNAHVIHAEQMALMGSDKEIYNGADIYVTYPPCDKCMVRIEQCKIKSVTFIDREGVLQHVKR